MNGKIFRLLQVSTSLLLLGRAYQHIFGDTPYRSLFWDEALLAKIVPKLLGITWDQYTESPEITAFILKVEYMVGAVLLLGVIAVWTLEKQKIFGRITLWACTVLLMILSLLYAKEKWYHLGQLFEYSLQFSSPLFLLFFIKKEKTNQVFFYMKIAIALTFICHGLYAFGIYPTPSGFVEMTLAILPLSEQGAVYFLKVAGVLDFLGSILIFFPSRKIQINTLIYLVFWGMATSFARLVAYVDWAFLRDTLHDWGYEFLVRTPHYLIPLVVLLFVINRGRKTA